MAGWLDGWMAGREQRCERNQRYRFYHTQILFLNCPIEVLHI
jgi:hypothetical protein